jgi:hypothetical protein
MARAFTFYQVLSLLAATPDGGMPTFCLDLLATFYDETASLIERRRLLRKCLAHLRRLSRQGPVAIAVFTADAEHPDEWLAMVEENVDGIWKLHHPHSPTPARLF